MVEEVKKPEQMKEPEKEESSPKNKVPKKIDEKNVGPPREMPKDIKKDKEVKKEPKEEVIEIIRVLSTDLNGKLKIKNSIRKIKGISFVTAEIFCEKARIDPNKITGTLNEEEIKRLEVVIKNPVKFKIPHYILNLRKNPNTGKNDHLTGAELQIEIRKILGDKMKIGSYVGIRHRSGLPVRGQRTRSSFRKSSSVGVSKKKLQPNKK